MFRYWGLNPAPRLQLESSSSNEGRVGIIQSTFPGDIWSVERRCTDPR